MGWTKSDTGHNIIGEDNEKSKNKPDQYIWRGEKIISISIDDSDKSRGERFPTYLDVQATTSLVNWFL